MSTGEDAPLPLGQRRMADADPDVIFRQIGMWARIRLDLRDAVGLPDGLMFAYGPRRGRRLHKFTVKLDASDTYVVEAGWLDRRTFDYVVAEQNEGVYADSLATVLEAMGTRATDGWEA